MSKNELIARLLELGELLGREIDTTGTIAELEQRVTEAEEELNDSDDSSTDGDSTEGGAVAGGDAGSEGKPSTGLVRVLMLKTAHMHATHETNDERVEIALAGTHVRVTPNDLAALEKAGIAQKED
ncbi:DNA-packaging protein [Erwinia endophytica]|uniref:DNA-packaging protein FI n=1 Tax=Erwinia endophytica TaxID=1563158 RepID=UPI001265DD86|nr:DNA-packaging protein FI [Erwinia endophytica]KAB8307256.1 DNA-packaging protein [Erwinia endophytica]